MLLPEFVGLPRPVRWIGRGLVLAAAVAAFVVGILVILYVLAIFVAIEIIASMAYGGR